MHLRAFFRVSGTQKTQNVLSAFERETRFLLDFTCGWYCTPSLYLSGLGLGLTLNSMIGIQYEYFVRYIRIVMGLIMVSAPMMLLVTPPVVAILLETYGRKGALMINMVCFLVIIICGAALRSKQKSPARKCLGKMCREVNRVYSNKLRLGGGYLNARALFRPRGG